MVLVTKCFSFDAGGVERKTTARRATPQGKGTGKIRNCESLREDRGSRVAFGGVEAGVRTSTFLALFTHKHIHLQRFLVSSLQHKLKCEQIVKEHVSMLEQLRSDRKELLDNLDDEKRKNENLQFRFEEVSIARADAEVRIHFFLKIFTYDVR